MLPWFEFADRAGRTWRVLLGHESESADLKDRWGVTIPFKLEIQISVTIPEHKFSEIVLHEVLHAALDHVPTLRPKFEEKAVNVVAAAAAETLATFGLRWPRLPAGYQKARADALALEGRA